MEPITVKYKVLDTRAKVPDVYKRQGLETGIVDGDLPLFAFLPADNAAVVRPAVDAAEVM